MTVNRVVLSCAACILLAIGVLAYVTLHDHAEVQRGQRAQDSFIHRESVQRVHTIGERCESQLHQAGEHGSQEQWFLAAHARCLESLAKVEARAGVKYSP